MTVAEVHARMSNAEYGRWRIFMQRRAQREEMAKAKGGTR